MTEVLADTATKYDINLNFTQIFCLTLYRITKNEGIFYLPFFLPCDSQFFCLSLYPSIQQAPV